MDLVEFVQHRRVKTLTRYWLALLRSYFRIEVEGLENIPKSGAALIIPNHSGFAGADAVLLTYIIRRETRRRARILAHRAFFDFSENLKRVSESFGLRKAAVQGGADMLARGRVVILFPEGETGNFKPTMKRYRLQPFHTGFLRMAIPSGAPVIPCVIVGAEESNINLGNLNLSKYVKGIRIPLPVNLVPLPAKWKIRFLPPVDSEELKPELLDKPEELKKLAHRIRHQMQTALHEDVKARKYVYFRQTRKIASKVTRKLKAIRSRS